MNASPTAARLSAELADQDTHDEAVSEISDTFEMVGGVAVHAAESLGVSHRALMRWVSRYPKLARRLRASRRQSSSSKIR